MQSLVCFPAILNPPVNQSQWQVLSHSMCFGLYPVGMSDFSVDLLVSLL